MPPPEPKPAAEPPPLREAVDPAGPRPARYAAGPSKDGPTGGASAPGVAEAAGHQGAPGKEEPSADTATVVLPLPRAAEAAAVHRVARRRTREHTQRTHRVDVRYSHEEKTAILRRARSLNIAGAHYIGAVVMAHLHGDLTLPGQRTPLDDYIDELNALRAQVARIGGNINQIARRLNSGAHPHPADTTTLAQAEHTLTTVRTTIAEIATAATQAITRNGVR
ncbi:plasmid mobilization relaxosome protein MobC [Streptomyces sp. NPDC004610]|uniref:plasmid mobilization relaxosome protein MobC n=1 Tax=unclassified Streptomyces TaxID=2593676 RepID=UPI0033ADC664